MVSDLKSDLVMTTSQQGPNFELMGNSPVSNYSVQWESRPVQGWSVNGGIKQ